MRTIRVTGRGKIKVHPDVTRITITLKGTDREYSETLRRSSADTETLKDLLWTFGFKRSDLKTLAFSVDPKYESYREKEEYRQRFVGYTFNHVLKVEFESNNERLGEILYALANATLEPEFHISYTVRDQEAAKNTLLGKAVADAKVKATVLTDAAGVRLKDIQRIDYAWDEIHFEVSPMRNYSMMDCKEATAQSSRYAMDIEPDDMEVSDTVTILWEIE